MTKEILQKAIQKAIDGGWSMPGLTDEGKMHFTDNGVVVDWLRGGRDFKSTETIIFNHDFAKVLWGDGCHTHHQTIHKSDYSTCRINWQYHLQKMVIAEDPIKYLGEHL